MNLDNAAIKSLVSIIEDGKNCSIETSYASHWLYSSFIDNTFFRLPFFNSNLDKYKENYKDLMSIYEIINKTDNITEIKSLIVEKNLNYSDLLMNLNKMFYNLVDVNENKFSEQIDYHIKRWSSFIDMINRSHLNKKTSNIDISLYINNIDKLKKALNSDNSVKLLVEPITKMLTYSNVIQEMSKTENSREKDENQSMDDFFINQLNEVKQNPILKKYSKINFENAIDLQNSINITKTIYNEFVNIYKAVKDKSKWHLNLADGFIHDFKDKKTITSKFLKSKFLNEHSIETVSLDNKKYKNMTIFEDNSIIFERQDNKYDFPLSNYEASNIATELLNDQVKYTLRKNPTLCKLFLKELNNNYKKFSHALNCMNTYVNNEDILKVSNFDISKKIKNANFERLDDEMNKIVNLHKLKNYAHSIASNKYLYLYNEESYEIIKELLDLKIESKLLQDNIGKKIAAFKTSEDFNHALNTLLNSYNEFNMEAVIIKSKNVNSEIVIQNENLLIMKIKDFDQSKILGSASWCISRHESYFNSYTNNANQYFIFDFSKKSKDPLSMIGVTININSDKPLITAAHNKIDDSISKTDQNLNILAQKIYIEDTKKLNKPIIVSSLKI